MNNNTEKLLANLQKAMHLMGRRAFASPHGPHEMAHRGQGRLLSIIAESQPIGQKELVEKLDIRPSSLSELLKKLEAKKLVARTPDEADKRNMLVSLTEEGRAAARKAEQRRDDITEKLFGALSEEEQAQLNAILEKLIDAWQEEAGDFPPHPHGCGPMGHGHGHHFRMREQAAFWGDMPGRYSPR